MYNEHCVFTTYPSPLLNPLFLLCFHDKKILFFSFFLIVILI